MAKIVLLGRHLHHTIWPLAQSLRAQQHRVHLVTARNATVSSTDDIEVLAYFKTWSTWEALRFLPVLISLNPQIFHLVLEKDEVSVAEWILSYAAQTLPNCVVTTSFLDPDRALRRNTWIKFLVEHSDIVTCPSMESLGHLRGLNVYNRRQSRGILPPMLENWTQAPVDSSEIDILNKSIAKKKMIAMPFFLNSRELKAFHLGLLQEISAKRPILFLGNWESWPVRMRKKIMSHLRRKDVAWTLSGSKDPAESQQLLRSCDALWLAGLPLTPTEYTQSLWMSWQTGVTPIIDTSQAIMHSGLWKNGVNCFILKTDNFQREVDRFLQTNQFQTAEHLTPQSAHDLIDHSTNDLNRLYNKALSQKEVS